MDSQQLTSLLSGKSLGATHSQAQKPEGAVPIPDLLGQALGMSPIPPPAPPLFQKNILPPPKRILTSILPVFAQLASQMMSELLEKPMALMQVNRTRRASIAQYLELLSEGAGGIPKKHSDPNIWLQSWIDGPRTPAQNIALLTYFEELAVFYLAQVLLLKAWTDRGIRRWKMEDLGSLNYHLSQALQGFLRPGNCERWNITTQNLFSWYNPGNYIQQDIWKKMESLRLEQETPQIMLDLFFGIRRHQPAWPELKSYDVRFYSSLWNAIISAGFNPSENSSPIPRKKIIFSPTLRDGTLMRSAPGDFQWIGTESQALQFYAAEFAKLWWGPCSPPLWTTGTGLETHSREQLSLGFSGTSLTSPILGKIAEIEACDLGFVVEEHCVRLNQKSGEAIRFKEMLDELEYFKKIRCPTSSMGGLQAGVTLTKLRPGGWMWWIREEPLTKNDGEALLSLFLEKSKLIAEWDFSQVEHSLPSPAPLFPKFVYLFQREASIDARHAHRPVRITIRGQIRSHIEVPVLLGSALSSSVLKTNPAPSQNHAWQIHRHESPTYQRDWIQKWPDPTNHNQQAQIEILRTQSDPLASFATVQVHGGKSSLSGATLPVPPIPSFVLKNAVWVKTVRTGDGCGLSVIPTFNRPPQEKELILIRFPDTTWLPPLKCYLESDLMRLWLENHCEKKNDRWVLTEALFKYLPIPRWLISALKDPPPISDPLPGQIKKNPLQVLESVQKNSQSPARGRVFVLCTRLLHESEEHLNALSSMVNPNGKMIWKQVLSQAMTGAEFLPATIHPAVRLKGSLPNHIPIGRFERVKSPSPGILFLTESGHSLYLFSDRTRVLDMIESLLEGVTHPTWGELADYLKLPKFLEVADTAANDLLKAHGELTEHRAQLQKLSQECLQLSIS